MTIARNRPSFEELYLDVQHLFPSTRVYSPGTRLLHQGRHAADVYLLRRGLVKMLGSNDGGTESIVGLRGAGTLLGVNAALSGTTCQVTKETVTACEVGHLDVLRFIELYFADSRVAQYVGIVQARENADHLERLLALGHLTARRRLERFLRETIDRVGTTQPRSEIRLLLPLTKTEIAQLISVSYEHLLRLFQQLEREGILRREKKTLVVMKPETLFHSF